jgi:hypothetical protein
VEAVGVYVRAAGGGAATRARGAVGAVAVAGSLDQYSSSRLKNASFSAGELSTACHGVDMMMVRSQEGAVPGSLSSPHLLVASTASNRLRQHSATAIELPLRPRRPLHPFYTVFAPFQPSTQQASSLVRLEDGPSAASFHLTRLGRTLFIKGTRPRGWTSRRQRIKPSSPPERFAPHRRHCRRTGVRGRQCRGTVRIGAIAQLDQSPRQTPTSSVERILRRHEPRLASQEPPGSAWGTANRGGDHS